MREGVLQKRPPAETRSQSSGQESQGGTATGNDASSDHYISTLSASTYLTVLRFSTKAKRIVCC